MERAIADMLEAYYAKTGQPRAETATSRRTHRRAMRELHEIGAGPRDVRDAVSEWFSRGYEYEPTPRALTRQWSSLRHAA